MSEEQARKTTTKDDPRVLPAIEQLSAKFDEILVEAKKPKLIVSDETVTTLQDKPIDIKLFAVDLIRGANVTFNIAVQPGAGTVSLDGNTVTYTPNQGFAGKDIFDYQAKDDHNQVSNLGKIGVIVIANPIPPPPSPTPIPPPPPSPTPSPPSPPSPPPPPPAPNVMGTVAIVNNSSASDSDIKNWVDAVKIQADRDVAPIWGHTVDFVITPKGQSPPNSDWFCGFFDNTDQPGDLGWHDVGPNGEPLIKCFVKEALKFGESPSVTLSHEIIESIGDANADTTVKGVDESGKPCLYFQELCDAVESNIYKINGVDVSDFVTPDWFNETPKSGEFDFLKHVDKAFTIDHGGYMEISYDNGRTWTEVDKNNKKVDLHKSEHSRWSLYKKPKEQRKKSTFKMS